MRIATTFVLVLAAAAGAARTPGQQRGALVASLPNNVRMEFVEVKPGEFPMGCSAGDTQCSDDEKPAHRVKITRGFEMGKYEVTSAQWQAVMVAPPLVSIPGSGDDHAMGQTGWNTAQQFLDQLNARKDGFNYRLPTEAEWEYAARAGTTGKYAGASPEAIGWFGQNVVVRPELVGKKAPNAWGLYDMYGNAWEFVQDWYSASYYATSPGSDPKGPASGQFRVLRGGSSLSEVKLARASARHFVGSPSSNDYYGFRVVREPAK